MAALEGNEIAFIRILLKGHVFFSYNPWERHLSARFLSYWIRFAGAFTSRGHGANRCARERRSGRYFANLTEPVLSVR
jgi:hypothetical protein